jgi:LPS-assembly protein
MKFKIVLFTVTLLFLFPYFAISQKIEEPITCNGDKVEYFPEKKVVVGTGNVEIHYKEMFLYADKVTIWMDEKKALAEGNVKLVKNGAIFHGDKLSYDFKKSKGKIINPSFEKYGPWYGKGLEAEEYEKGKILVKKGYITTCNFKKPHYRFQAKTIKIYLNDRVVARNVIFYVKDKPIFYIPYLSRSLKDKHMPFTIIPGKNDDWGWYVLTSWKYFLNENQQGKVRLDYRELKGFAHGIEHEFKTKKGEGLFKYYYMEERNKKREEGTSFERQRYRVTTRYRYQPDLYTSIYGEYNELSDIDFLKDYFYEEEYEKDPQPPTYLSLIRRYPHFVLNFNLRKRTNRFFSVTEKLPEVGIDVPALRIKNSSFYYRAAHYFDNLTNKNVNSGLDDDVWRFDSYNEISHVKKYFGFLNFTPYIGMRQSFYSKNIYGDEHKIRGIFYTGFDASTKFYKIFYPKDRFLFVKAEKARHVLMPIISYKYIAEPTILKEKLMQFDDTDSIERKSRLTLSLENLWQIKYSQDDELKTRDIARFIISGDYDFKIEGGSRWTQATMDLEYYPFDWLRFDSDATYDSPSGHFETANFDVSINKKRWQLGLGHRYERDTASQLTTEFTYKINKKWKFRTYQRIEFENNSFERQEFTLYRDLHCWLDIC